MEGYLNKSSSYFSRWKRRFFVLKDNILYYYKEKGGELRGRFHLSISSIKDYDENDKRFELDSGLKTVSIRAVSKEERDIWIKKIKENQLDHLNFEKEFLKRNQEMFKSQSNDISEEIKSLQSKLNLIKQYVHILESYNKKIYDLSLQKNCGDEIKSITNASKVFILQLIVFR